MNVNSSTFGQGQESSFFVIIGVTVCGHQIDRIKTSQNKPIINALQSITSKKGKNYAALKISRSITHADKTPPLPVHTKLILVWSTLMLVKLVFGLWFGRQGRIHSKPSHLESKLCNRKPLCSELECFAAVWVL